jgi:hypothetical protein
MGLRYRLESIPETHTNQHETFLVRFRVNSWILSCRLLLSTTRVSMQVEKGETNTTFKVGVFGICGYN